MCGVSACRAGRESLPTFLVETQSNQNTLSGVPEWSPRLPHLGGSKNMMNRTVVALLLAGALTLPAFAQQNNSNTQNQSATQAAPASTDQSQSTTGASGKPALQPDTHEGFWGHLNPFARKKYVQRQTQPIKDRV